jgi:hypothetical protein
MHHHDAPDLDPRTDITDLYIFQNPGNPTSSILILNVNPEALRRANAFDPQASYEFKIDTNGDFEAEIAFHILFTPVNDGQQTASVYRVTDEAARGTGPVGEAIIQQAPVSFIHEARITAQASYRFFAGIRSEPFFADPTGFFNNLQWSGQDFWAGKNVFSIVLDVPNSALGPQPQIGVWGRTMAIVNGTRTSVNQMGRPGNNALRQGAGDYARAVRLNWAAKNVFELVGTWKQEDESVFEDILKSCRAALGESAFAIAAEEGRAMTMEQAAAYALETADG